MVMNGFTFISTIKMMHLCKEETVCSLAEINFKR